MCRNFYTEVAEVLLEEVLVVAELGIIDLKPFPNVINLRFL